MTQQRAIRGNRTHAARRYCTGAFGGLAALALVGAGSAGAVADPLAVSAANLQELCATNSHRCPEYVGAVVDAFLTAARFNNSGIKFCIPANAEPGDIALLFRFYLETYPKSQAASGSWNDEPASIAIYRAVNWAFPCHRAAYHTP
jgi:hypothetical protein